MASNQKTRLTTILPYALSLLILIAYVLCAIQYTKIIEPVMDEGTYLLKGKWYLDGTYEPFEDYGPITNKPPLSFYSLGISQIVFKPGLASGRYFAVFLSVLLLIGQWMTVRRLAGKWWATASIALYLISPAWIIYYSRAMTQVVTSLLIVWSLYFLLGENRKKGQLMLGLILAAMTVMVRQNLLPFFIFSIFYVIWENGFKKSWLPVLVGLLAFLGLNIPYWPQIYPIIWKPYFPAFFNNLISSFYDLSFASGDLGKAILEREYGWIYETQVLFDSVRYFFIPIFATILSFLLLFPTKMFKDSKHKKTLYLAGNFLFLSVIHFYYVVLRNNVLYSFPAYIAFYLPLGITIIPLLFKDILELKNKTRQWIVSITVVLLCTGIGLSLYREIAPALMNLNLPSISQGKIFNGPYELWDVLLNRFHISIRTQEFILPTIAGFLTSIVILILSWITHSIVHRNRKGKSYSFGSILILGILCLSVLFSPTFILAKNSSIATCPGSDVPAHYEKNGEKIKSLIPSGSHVYWEGPTPILFLYLPEVEVFPTQLNMQFYYRVGGDAEFVEKRGYWNEELALRWITEADFLVFDEESYSSRFKSLDAHIQSQFQEVDQSIILDPCDSTSTLIILQRMVVN
ncbi:MAG TPA: hypothetical protein DCK95_05510 [Anaerolineaceae bacterium]|nr:hypothetical protein [Anaerolineaceae bacterium]